MVGHSFRSIETTPSSDASTPSPSANGWAGRPEKARRALHRPADGCFDSDDILVGKGLAGGIAAKFQLNVTIRVLVGKDRGGAADDIAVLQRPDLQALRCLCGQGGVQPDQDSQRRAVLQAGHQEGGIPQRENLIVGGLRCGVDKAFPAPWPV